MSRYSIPTIKIQQRYAQKIRLVLCINSLGKRLTRCHSNSSRALYPETRHLKQQGM